MSTGATSKVFVNINYLQDWSEERLLFMLDKHSKLYLPWRIKHNQDESYTVVNKINGQSLPELERLFEMCIHLYERLECALSTIMATFQQIAVIIRHCQSLLMEEIERLDATGVKIQVGAKGRDQILKKLVRLEKLVSDWNHKSVCLNMFHGLQN
ncbi:hypothetical protein CPB97_007568 [Podila verticillata]|nr:hypothetical protein CPB97_007568 [Podila verticillata]